MSLFLLSAGGSADADAEIVGAKAAGLMRMADAALPVPPAFVLGTALCADYHARGGRLDADVHKLIARGIRHLEQRTGRRFDARRKPLLVSVRSGAPVSMPGMLDTVLNVGLSETTLPGLLQATGDPVFVWDSFRRLIQCYAEVVGGSSPTPFTELVDDAIRRHGVPAANELDVAALRELTTRLLDTYRTVVGRPFPQDPVAQLTGAIEGVFRSWNSDRAVTYRRLERLTGLPGTAVTVQAMVFGNRGLGSGSGVAFTRDPATGEHRLYVDFLLDAQGEDVVAGRTRIDNGGMAADPPPALARQLGEVSRTLEAVFTDAQDFEFTVEEGTLWLLQTRDAKRTPWAALRIACDLVDEGIIDRRTALDRLRGYDLNHITRHRLVPGGAQPSLGRAVPAGTGCATGPVALDATAAASHAEHGEPAILVRPEASTDDVAALAVCGGLLTARGTRTSHAAVVARQLGLVCLVDCTALTIDAEARTVRIGTHELHEGDPITVDGSDGRVYAGALELIEERPIEFIDRVHAWQRSRSARHE
ncbi:PEP/pyruvate-binding domain-containing protein [Amycolatopsis mongoliensis]|uniref:PEP/pyruvate-binding domain-containing protein n=1 Tax=Amycolatopsis mongoliensis TaxID=715475 RepID=A0A9Y2JXV0_9PSEU|nr:PEP/pyruvate-binding domain-containing protein [Amycolatopsis sp. 4-36]WIY06665.1 PEP/pyruvate-binding domain-containing protein [Amycolatopsis sp. 4-36]